MGGAVLQRMRYLGLVACALACGCVDMSASPPAPAVQVGPNDYLRLDQGANGDVACDRGTIYLPASASINGDLDGTSCALKIEGIVNGSITASGGLLHLIDVSTVNGEVDVHDADEVVVLASVINGPGTFIGDRTVDIEDTSFNGSLQISNSGACKETGNQTNGSLDVSGCQ